VLWTGCGGAFAARRGASDSQAINPFRTANEYLVKSVSTLTTGFIRLCEYRVGPISGGLVLFLLFFGELAYRFLILFKGDPFRFGQSDGALLEFIKSLWVIKILLLLVLCGGVFLMVLLGFFALANMYNAIVAVVS